MRDCRDCKWLRIKDWAFGICQKRDQFIEEMPRICTDWEGEDESHKQSDRTQTDVSE